MNQQIDTQMQQEYTTIMNETKELLNAAFDAVDLTFKEHLRDIHHQDALSRAINSSKSACDSLNEYRNRLEMMLNLTQSIDGE